VDEAILKAETLIEALPYIQSFRRKFVVVKFGGQAMDAGGDLSNVLLSVVFMSQVGMFPVLVHGGGKRISEEMERRDLKPTFRRGHRVTDEAALAVVQDVLIDAVNADLVATIQRLNGRAVGVHPRGNRLLTAEPYRPPSEDGLPVDLGFVGRLTQVDTESLERLCQGGLIPVVAPLATDESGQVYNVNADTAAGDIAAHLEAEKIVFLSDVHGIMAEPGNPDTFLSTVSESEIEAMETGGVISDGMLPKVDACLTALKAGVRKAHIIDGRIAHSLLLEIFTDQGIGTQIVR